MQHRCRRSRQTWPADGNLRDDRGARVSEMYCTHINCIEFIVAPTTIGQQTSACYLLGHWTFDHSHGDSYGSTDTWTFIGRSWTEIPRDAVSGVAITESTIKKIAPKTAGDRWTNGREDKCARARHAMRAILSGMPPTHRMVNSIKLTRTTRSWFLSGWATQTMAHEHSVMCKARIQTCELGVQKSTGRWPDAVPITNCSVQPHGECALHLSVTLLYVSRLCLWEFYMHLCVRPSSEQNKNERSLECTLTRKYIDLSGGIRTNDFSAEWRGL